MPEPQQQQPGTTVDDYVRVKGPNGKTYRFPSGTTKDVAVNYFKNKGIGVSQAPTPQAKPLAQQPTPQPTQQKKPPETDLLTKGVEGAYGAAQKVLQVRPRWDTPTEVLKDPSWLGRTARYYGGEYIGESKALVGVGLGGGKLLYDLWRASLPVPLSEHEANHPLSHKGEQYAKVGSDIADVGKGFKDLGQTVWDFVRHFPEAEADPEKFGQTVTNAALTVDGAVKFAANTAKMMKQNPAQAGATASNATNKVPSRFFQRAAYEDAYVHTKGLDVAKKISLAVKQVHEEVELHAGGIAKQIDTAIPSGVIDATDSALTIMKEFQDVVKTPETAHPALRQMVKDAQATSPGQWSWEKTRQFRSSIGRALSKVQGPQKAVLTRVYADLTKRLGDIATQYGLGDSWKHYNELERKMSQQFGDTVDSVRDAQSGKEVVQVLSKDKALTGELANNLAKYGLNKAEVMKFVADADKISKSAKGWRGTLFRMAYGTPGGVATMIAARAAGAGWLPSVGAGALVGVASSHLINLARALRLSPDIIEHMLQQRELPGKMKVPTGSFPAGLSTTTLEGGPGGSPEGGTGGGDSPTGLSRLEGSALKGFLKRHPEDMARLAKQIAQGGPEAEAAKVEMRKLLQGDRKTDVSPPQGVERRATTAPAQLPAPKTEPTVTKAAPGEVGREPGARPGTTKESKIGRNTKQAERVAKKRAEAMRTKQAEEAEAQARAQAKDVNVSHFQVPELEESLQQLNPKSFTALQKYRKLKGLSDDEYRGALQELILRAYEQGSH